jgi:hypothetical protein
MYGGTVSRPPDKEKIHSWSKNKVDGLKGGVRTLGIFRFFLGADKFLKSLSIHSNTRKSFTFY